MLETFIQIPIFVKYAEICLESLGNKNEPLSQLFVFVLVYHLMSWTIQVQWITWIEKTQPVKI